ncbi:MAG TPA: phosphatidate cytidylyltransferase [Gammaproteobacteria bacterium]|nr:phosphatidate cytidylyltransferase [Gammaproteobacteria bacterium]
MLKQRLLTAAILIPLLIWGIFKLPDAGFVALLASFVMLGAWEWTRICEIKNPLLRFVYLCLFGICLYLLWKYDDPGLVLFVLALSLCWWSYAVLLILAYSRGRDYLRGHQLIKALVGFVLLLPPFMALITLRSAPAFGPGYVLLLLLLIWSADSAAYFSGRQWGRRKLLPRVSPGKSWEGVAGAMLAATLLAIGAAFYFELPPLEFVILALVVTAISIAGDLTESLFKRQVNIKDSGVLLPGHGGVLDRIDSLTSAAPFFLGGMLLIVGKV